MIPETGSRPDVLLVLRKIARHLLWTGAVLAAALLWVSPASAATPCAQKVIDDWYGNGRVDDVYPLKCYRDALKSLPDDVENYSNAPDVIERALQDAIRADQAGTPPAGEEPGETTPDDSGVAPTPGGSNDPPAPGSGPTPEPPVDEGAAEDAESPGSTDNGVLGEAIEKLGSGSADSVPIPLIVIGALALCLLAAGSAGLIARKLNARKVAQERAEPPGGGGRGPGS